MARLPNPGGDPGEWGAILNEYLLVEHNADGTLKAAGTLSNKAPLADPVFTGHVTVPAPTNDTDATNKDYVDDAVVAGLAAVNTPVVSTLSSVSDLIRNDSGVVLLDNQSGSALTLTSTPTISSGSAGQTLTLVNASSDPVTLQGEASLPGSGLGMANRTLSENQVITLVYANGLWLDRAGLFDSLNVSGDAEVTNESKGVVLHDRANGNRYRLYMDNGVLGTELL